MMEKYSKVVIKVVCLRKIRRRIGSKYIKIESKVI